MKNRKSTPSASQSKHVPSRAAVLDSMDLEILSRGMVVCFNDFGQRVDARATFPRQFPIELALRKDDADLLQRLLHPPRLEQEPTVEKVGEDTGMDYAEATPSLAHSPALAQKDPLKG
ncbi:MAG: hypothetical protein N2C14_02830, partial [Planctomycetales bacterium]